jgi:hypothetical protein
MNPGAFDYPGNGLDEDCSGAPDDAAASCDEGLAGGTDPADLAHAFDLCPAAFGAPAWHIQSAALLRADGLGLPVAGQYAVSGAFGGYLPQAGSALVVLSTGSVAPSGAPGFADFQPGTSRGTTSGFPQDWLAGNGGALPNAPGCPVPMGAVANDPVMFQLYLKVPTNARAFRLKAAFLSAEFPEWTCSPYNDFFVVLLDSSHAGPLANPSDKNLATFDGGDSGQPGHGQPGLSPPARTARPAVPAARARAPSTPAPPRRRCPAPASTPLPALALARPVTRSVEGPAGYSSRGPWSPGSSSGSGSRSGTPVTPPSTRWRCSTPSSGSPIP